MQCCIIGPTRNASPTAIGENKFGAAAEVVLDANLGINAIGAFGGLADVGRPSVKENIGSLIYR